MEVDNKNLKIKKAIWKTIAFFDIFDFPLTELELWRFLPLKCDFAELSAALDDDNKIDKKNGFYFFIGRQETIKTRQRRYNYSDIKFKKASRLIRLFGLIPWIKMIAVVNIVGPHNSKKESDIDFFIVTEKNRIWMSRFFCVLIAEFFRLRPKKDDFKDKICLSFFVDCENQFLKNFHLSDFDIDIYFTYWLANLSPIFERKGAYQSLLSKNEWLFQCLPNWQPADQNYLRKKEKNKKSRFKLSSFFCDKLEKFFKVLSLKMMNQELKKHQRKSNDVIISDGVLKLHIKDRRREIQNLWLKKINVKD